MNVSRETIKKILVISGPTASGKSSLALKVAQEKDSVIINADSVQLYKDLPILSAQPSKNELKKALHLLYSVLEYDQDSSVNNWLKLAKKEIDQTLLANKLPIIVGGTGLYLSKLIDGIHKIPNIEKTVREECRELFFKSGAEALKKELLRLGEKINEIKDLDKQRLLRRLEILKQTGKTISYWHSEPKIKFYNEDNFIHFNIESDRKELYDKCNLRFEEMLENGAILEVENLMQRSKDILINKPPILKTIGFLEIGCYLKKEISKQEMINIATQKTRNYAKRQLSWFRNQFQNKHLINNVSRETLKEILQTL